MPGLVRRLCSYGSTNRTPDSFTEPSPNHLGPHPDADPGSKPSSKPDPDFSTEQVARNVRPHCGPIGVACHLGANHLGANHLRAEPRAKPDPDFSTEHIAHIVTPNCGPIVVACHLGANHLGANHLGADGRTYIAANNHTDPKSNLGANTDADGAADNCANPRSNADVPWETRQLQYVQTLHRSELRGYWRVVRLPSPVQ